LAAQTIPSPGAETSGVHLPQLDSLRGVACLMVLVAHLKSIRFMHWMPDSLGAAGVGIFFVLSGFLITRILLADRAAGRGLTAFYNRRVARIFPIYYLTLAVLAVAWPGRELGWAANFTFNFRFLADSRDYFRTDAASAVPPVGHFWSLCVEEHFYWFWPLAVMVLPRASLRFVLAAIVAATPFVAYRLADWLAAAGFSQSDVEGLLSRMTFTQLVAISLGALAALHEGWLTGTVRLTERWSLSRATAVGAALILAAAGWFAASPEMPGAIQRAAASTALHVVCGGVFLLVFRAAPLGRLGWLAGVGTISYGLYLYHLPVYAALGLANAQAEANLFVGVAAVCTTFALAAASYRFLEYPLLRRVRSRQHARGPGVRSYSHYLGKALTVAVALFFGLGLAKSYREVRAMTKAKARFAAVQGTSASGERVVTFPQVQGFGATVTTLVVGSSHAELGIAAPECAEPTYNLAFGGQDLWYDCELVKHFLERMPALKRIVFCVDPYTLHYSIGDTDGEKWRESLYFNACGLRARIDDDRKYSPIVLAAAEHSAPSIAILREKMSLSDASMRGWRPETNSVPFDPNRGASRAREIEHRPDRMDDNVAHLTRALQACKSKGVECVLVSVPAHRTYRDQLSPGYLAEATAAVQRIVQAEGVPYLAYTESPQFEDADFFDCDHLNREGAIKFTRQFDADWSRLRRPAAK